MNERHRFQVKRRIGSLASATAIAALALGGVIGPGATAWAEVQTAIEYKLTSYWDDYGPYSEDAYFVTSFPEEIASLKGLVDAGAIVLTGESFDVWSAPTDAALATCRFWGPSFQAHFFTHHDAECANLRAGQDWQYEGIAFYMQLPDDNG